MTICIASLTYKHTLLHQSDHPEAERGHQPQTYNYACSRPNHTLVRLHFILAHHVGRLRRADDRCAFDDPTPKKKHSSNFEPIWSRHSSRRASSSCFSCPASANHFALSLMSSRTRSFPVKDKFVDDAARPAATPTALGLAGRLSRKLRRWRPTVASSEGAWKQRPWSARPRFHAVGVIRSSTNKGRHPMCVCVKAW